MKTKLFLAAFAIFLFARLIAQPWEVPPGEGTINDPYLISTLEHLSWISRMGIHAPSDWSTGKYFVQTQDIDASETANVFVYDYEGWRPIGETNTFNGFYEGQGYSIDGLFIDQTSLDYSSPAGFFSKVGAEAEIKNLTLTNVNMTGKGHILTGNVIGGLTGINYGYIENCQVSGEITTGLMIGGLVGENFGTIKTSETNCTITGSYSIGGIAGGNQGIIEYSGSGSTVLGNSYLGGIAGENHNLIDNCTFFGNLTGTQNIGGIAGFSTGIISNSRSHVSSGEITGTYKVGGLVGKLTQHYETGGDEMADDDETPGLIINSYATSNVSGLGWIGGLVGGIEYGGMINNCYAEGNVTSTGGSGSGFGGLVGIIYFGGEIHVSYAKGNVTGNLQYDLGGLVGFAYQEEGEGVPWQDKPILIDQCFATGHVSGVASVGGLVGSFTHYSEPPSKSGGSPEEKGIRNSFAIGDVSGNENVGGLVGSLVGTVSFVYATGDVSGNQKVGGLVGNNHPEGEIQQSYFTGTVNGTYNIGGLAGYNDGLIQDSYAMYESGDIVGVDYVGGIAGYNYGSIINCYTPGNIAIQHWLDPNRKDRGFLVGHNEYWEDEDEIFGGEIEHSIHPGTKETCASGGPGDGRTDCSWMGVGNMYPDPPGAISVSSLAAMQLQATFTSEGWDFDNIWEIEPYGYNQGLPYHQWQKNVAPILPVMRITMGYEEISCYNATQKILLEDFVMHDGNSATLISGYNIIMTPGVQINSGAYFHAYITPDSTFCVNPTPLMLAEDDKQDDEPFVPSIEKEIFFHIFPNPTTGLFTLELKEFDESSAITVEISSMVGERIIRQELPVTAHYQFDLSRFQPGIYLVRVIQGNEAGVLKVVKK